MGSSLASDGPKLAMALPRIEDVERELVRRRGLHAFIKLAWPLVESVPFVDGWHLEEIAAHLEAVSKGELKRLIINVPPGCMKSLSVSVMWPGWDWIEHGADKFMYASFDLGLSQRDALRTKALVRSDWFQRRWGYKANPQALADLGLKPVSIAGVGDSTSEKDKDLQDTASIYWTTQGGFRFSTSTKGKATGWHSHKQVVDDPTNPTRIQGGGKAARAELKRTEDWYSGTMSTRKANPQDFARVIIMQRLHSNDLCGLMERNGEYTVLKLPMNRGKVRCITPWGGDRREQEGELLCPARFDAQAVATTRKDLGPANAAAQLDQNPSSESGAIIKRAWTTKRYRLNSLPQGLTWLQFWDLSFDDTETASYVAGQTWATNGVDFYLIDRRKKRMDFPETCAEVLDFRKRWPQVKYTIIEKKANGSALIKQLNKVISGLIPWDPGTDSKEGRMHAVSGYFEAGNVWFPEDAPWLPEYLEEIVDFPKAPNDDEADCTSMALARMSGKKKSRLAAAMDNLKL